MFSAPASPVPPRTASDALIDSDVSPGVHAPQPHRTFSIRDPSTDELLAAVTATDERGVRGAVARARAAAPRWARAPIDERTTVLRRWAAALHEHAGELARLLSRETGALPDDARAQIDAGVAAIERHATLDVVDRRDGRTAPGRREGPPNGTVVAVLLPWRDPVALGCAQVAACLATGHAVVVKPSGRAPLSVERAVRLLAAPTDVVALINGGAETGVCLVGDPEIGVVVHTGSVESGRTVAASCAAPSDAILVERGGKAAVVVDRDVDPAAAAAFAATAAFSHTGQLCGSVDRLLVHRAVYDRFLGAFLARAENLRRSPGLGRTTTLAPLIDARQRATVHGQAMAAVADGANLLTGGALPHGVGCFYPATVLDHVRPGMAVWSQKTFGPIAALMPFDDLAGALEMAADGGLDGGTCVLTGDHAHAERARRRGVDPIDPARLGRGAAALAAERLRQRRASVGYGARLLDVLPHGPLAHGGP